MNNFLNLSLSKPFRIISFILFIFPIIFFFYGCNSCSKSGIRENLNNNNKQFAPSSTKRVSAPSNTIQMVKNNGVYQIPVDINGVPMYFIFDTGAGLISISATEAIFLFKQGKLTSEDVIGKANFIDANGEISEGTIINLREVKIGNKLLHNIEASVVNNLEAPLLMGQSALQKFGKISIDYTRNEITFQ